jgi:ABC transport system ATP-binding/permease protein
VKKRLSFKEQHEYEQLEKDIAQLEQRKATLMEQLHADSTTHEDLMKWSQELEQIQATLDKKSDRWLELSEYA